MTSQEFRVNFSMVAIPGYLVLEDLTANVRE